MEAREWKAHCEALGVSESASLPEIKKAFRKLSWRYHPDHNPEASREQFQRINNSYCFLLDHYGEYLAENSSPQPSVAKFEKPPLAAGNQQYWGEPLRAGFLVVLLISVSWLAVLDTLSPGKKSALVPPAPLREPAETISAARIESCRVLSFQNGNLLDQWTSQQEEPACYARCLAWLEENFEKNVSCHWANREFHQHSAPAAPSPAPLPTPATPSFAPPPKEVQVYIENDEPALLDRISVETRSLRVGDEDTIELNFVPRVWLKDSLVLQGRQGTTRHQVKIWSLRRGDTSVVFMDQANRPIRKIFYFVK